MSRARRGSVAVSVNSNNMLDMSKVKEVTVRTPRRGRSKSIVVPGAEGEINKNFPIGRLNNYSKQLKMHKGPLSMVSELESIDEEFLGGSDGFNFSNSQSI